jgi:transposase-like protein
MAARVAEEQARAKAERWRERIAEQQGSGLSVKQFCQDRGLASWLFYKWRKQLREAGPVRFALVERNAVGEQGATTADLEVVFARGKRLRIRRGVDSGLSNPNH